MGKKRGNSHSSTKGLHEISIDEVYSQFDVSSKGLTQTEVEKRQQRYGLNKLSEKKDKPWYVKLLLQFNNFFSYLLLFGSLLSFIGEWLQPGQGYVFIAIALLAVVLLNSGFTFFQEYQTNQAMKSFSSLISTSVIVFRNGERVSLASTELVPGDLIELAEGDKIAADARLFEEFSLKVDHAALTGESEPQLRSLKATSKRMILSRNMVFSGTLVQQGSGKAVVIATGDDTQIGKIAKETTEISAQTSHLQKEIGSFIHVISRIAIFLGVLFFGIGFFVHISDMTLFDALVINLVFAIGIIVANVPEGLLPTVTLTLSIAAQKLAKKQVLVKNIDAIETIGSVTVICTDKTGTLTENNLSVVGVYLNEKEYLYDKKLSVLQSGGSVVRSENLDGFSQVLESCTLCNNAKIGGTKSFGDPIDITLQEFASGFINVNHFRSESPRLFEVPFSSETKFMGVAHLVGTSKECIVKGAPEIVLEKCNRMSLNGKFVNLTRKKREELLKQNISLAKKGYRVLAIARKSLKGKPEPALNDGEYVFYGFVFMQDPPRSEVLEAVSKTQAAGIKIIVISGDQGTTVASIASQVGITTQPYILSGDDMMHLTDTQLKSVLQKPELIVARALPKDKLRIVTLLQQMGEIVAVTGDGVNDAPAIKKADVGISMGISGTEVAKEASDIVLLDDNFASITRAINYGRTIYDNIKHFITYILTSNTPQIIPFLAFVVLDWPLALPTLLILAIDLGTDLLPAIGLGLDSSSREIMHRPPRDKGSKLLTWRMIARSYGYVGGIQTAAAYIVFFHILGSGGWNFGDHIGIYEPLYHSAVAGFFMTVVVSQAFNLISCRTTNDSALRKRLGSNWLLPIGVVVSFVLVAVLINLELTRTIFGLNFFDFKYVWWAFGLGSLILIVEEIRKFFTRRYGWFSLR